MKLLPNAPAAVDLDFAPAQKSWMENQAGYRRPVELGDVMPGSGAGVVVESEDPRFTAGDIVMGYLGWAEYPVVDGGDLTRAPAGVDLPSLLGVLGVIGPTRMAYERVIPVVQAAADALGAAMDPPQT